MHTFFASRARPGANDSWTQRSSAPSSGLSLKDTAVAARNEEQRLLGLEGQLVQQLEAVRREKKDVEDLLAFLERKREPEPAR